MGNSITKVDATNAKCELAYKTISTKHGKFTTEKYLFNNIKVNETDSYTGLKIANDMKIKFSGDKNSSLKLDFSKLGDIIFDLKNIKEALINTTNNRTDSVYVAKDEKTSVGFKGDSKDTFIVVGTGLQQK